MTFCEIRQIFPTPTEEARVTGSDARPYPRDSLQHWFLSRYLGGFRGEFAADSEKLEPSCVDVYLRGTQATEPYLAGSESLSHGPTSIRALSSESRDSRMGPFHQTLGAILVIARPYYRLVVSPNTKPCAFILHSG